MPVSLRPIGAPSMRTMGGAVAGVSSAGQTVMRGCSRLDSVAMVAVPRCGRAGRREVQLLHDDSTDAGNVVG